jgi:hypothetical protein
MTLPKCPCGGEAVPFANRSGPVWWNRCNLCNACTGERATEADAERAWCRMVAAPVMEKALGKAIEVERRRLWNSCFDCGENCPENRCAAGERGHAWVAGARAALKAARGEEGADG